MLDLYDIGGDEWTEVLQMVRDARAKGWWSTYGLSNMQDFVKFETDAAELREFCSGFVPGLLQTPAYSRTLFESSFNGETDEEIEIYVRLRMQRQGRLTDSENPLQLHTVIDEAVLRNPVGGAAVHRGQVARLLEAADLPTVDLRVLTEGQGAHPGLGSGFVLLSFGDLEEPDMAYVEHALGAAYLHEPREVSTAFRKFDTLQSLALSSVDSIAWLRKLVEAL